MLLARLERSFLFVALFALLITLAHVNAGGSRPRRADGEQIAARLDAATVVQVSWPPSTGFLVAEVVTRGAASADQFVELYNASAGALDLAGLELVYVTASGLTITRKQTWTSLVVPSHAHVLIANAAGIYAATADGLFSNGGFSTSGGSLVLRTVSGGQVIDSLSWGTAVSSFVEGAVGTAPPTGSSLERKPGGVLGNATDTNDNAADTRLEPAPVPQNLAAQPVPEPSASATLAPTPTPSPMPTPDPTATPSPEPTLEPTAEPTVEPTATPQPTVQPTAEPTAQPTPTLAPSPTAPPLTVAQARSLPIGSYVTIAANLTTQTGLTETGHGAFAQDATGGIALYLSTGEWPLISDGTDLVVSGVLETRYSLLTLRVADASAIAVIGAGVQPVPVFALTGTIGEALESQLVVVEGQITETAATLSDGFSTAIDDGSGALRVIVGTAAGISPETLPRGSRFQLIGVVGQRDTSGTGLAGYRLHLRTPVDVIALPDPTPAPTPTQEPTAEPSASPSPAPTPTASPSPAPTPTAVPTAAPISIATARMAAVGESVRVRGVVTVEPGRIPGDGLFALQDETAGICVQLPADWTATPPARGATITVTGVIASPYGNLELRPATAGDIALDGSAAVPTPRALQAADLGESTEGLLAMITGTLTRSESSTTSVTLFVDDGSAEARIFMSAALGVAREDYELGSRLQVTGIVADRLGLYRLWPRDASDIAVLAGPSPSPTPAPSPSAGPSSAPTPTPTPAPTGPAAAEVMPIANALRHAGQTVAIEGVVTAPAGLLDADARRVTLQDASAAILVRLPADTSAELGQKVLIVGEVGTYYGAPQMAATIAPVDLSGGGVPAPIVIRAARLDENLEWRLVTVTGTVTAVNRDGASWKAELQVGGGSIPISGVARSGIPSTALVVGRSATVIGIVKRPYPSASDLRYMLVPRMASDIKLGGQAPAASGVPATAGAYPIPVAGSSGAGGNGPGDGSASAPQAGRIVVIALADIAAHEAETVLIGGRIEAVDGNRVLVNDGTSVAALQLSPQVRGSVSPQPGMLVNARGVVTRTDQGGLEIVITDVGSLTLLDAQLAVDNPDAGAAASPAEEAATTSSTSAPASGVPVLVLIILLLLAGAFGTAGITFARRPQLLHAIAQAVAVMRRRG